VPGWFLACRTAARRQGSLNAFDDRQQLQVLYRTVGKPAVAVAIVIGSNPCSRAAEVTVACACTYLTPCTVLSVLVSFLAVQVEAQIEEVSASVDAATKALPQLSKEQQAAQVRSTARSSLPSKPVFS
jgi:hypothetical protein